MRTIWIGACLIAGGALLAHGVALWAQDAAPPGIHMSAESVAAAMKAGDLAVDGSGSLVGAGRVTNIFPEGMKLSASSRNMLIRTRTASEPNNASIHPDVTEIYYIVDGSGTFMTGGTISDPNNRAAGTTGGVASNVSRGDFVILPPETAHWFSKINGSVTYIETRFEARQVPAV